MSGSPHSLAAAAAAASAAAAAAAHAERARAKLVSQTRDTRRGLVLRMSSCTSAVT
jgi:hypothetical protein